MELDTCRRSTLRLMESCERIHGMVESAFPGKRTRNLWRIDLLDDKTYLLILSEEEPDLAAAVQRYAPEGGAWQTKDYSPLLNRIKDGTVWRFRLTANPTKSEAREGRRGEVRACGPVSEQERWLMDRAGKYGFALREGEFRVTESRWYSFKKGREHDRPVMLRGASYEGLLTVVDEERFRELLCRGMGRGKAYGMGMLTVVRP